MKGSIDRQIVFEKLIDRLKKDVKDKGVSLAHTETARREAPGRMEARYDSRKEEMGRLVDSQVKLISQTEKIIKHIEKLSQLEMTNLKTEVGNIVTLSAGKNALSYLLVDQGGGLSADIKGGQVMTLNADSVIGKMLLGKKIGDEVEMLNNKFKIASIQ